MAKVIIVIEDLADNEVACQVIRALKADEDPSVQTLASKLADAAMQQFKGGAQQVIKSDERAVRCWH